jgi:hypothetical protein
MTTPRPVDQIFAGWTAPRRLLVRSAWTEAGLAKGWHGGLGANY